MALTDADRLHMVSMALMQHSVITKIVSSGASGFIYGISENTFNEGVVIFDTLYGTPEVVE